MFFRKRPAKLATKQWLVDQCVNGQIKQDDRVLLYPSLGSFKRASADFLSVLMEESWPVIVTLLLFFPVVFVLAILYRIYFYLFIAPKPTLCIIEDVPSPTCIVAHSGLHLFHLQTEKVPPNTIYHINYHIPLEQLVDMLNDGRLVFLPKNPPNGFFKALRKFKKYENK